MSPRYYAQHCSSLAKTQLHVLKDWTRQHLWKPQAKHRCSIKMCTQLHKLCTWQGLLGQLFKLHSSTSNLQLHIFLPRSAQFYRTAERHTEKNPHHGKCVPFVLWNWTWDCVDRTRIARLTRQVTSEHRANKIQRQNYKQDDGCNCHLVTTTCIINIYTLTMNSSITSKAAQYLKEKSHEEKLRISERET